MADYILFRGILPALITPLNDDATVKVHSVKPGFDVGHAAMPARRYTGEQRDEIIQAYREVGLFDE